MPTLDVWNMQGEKIGNLELSDTVFGAEINSSLMHQAVVKYLAAQRQGTSKVKNRSAVRGGGRKPWRQKGTGRARIGTIRAPHWTGGGVVFGPQPRDYTKKMNKKAKRQAIRSALSSKLASDEIIIVDGVEFEKPKTKDMIKFLQNVNAGKKSLVITGENDKNVVLSARNIPNVFTVSADTISVYQLLNCESLIMTKDSVKKVEEVFA